MAGHAALIDAEPGDIILFEAGTFDVVILRNVLPGIDDAQQVARLAEALAEWFPQHAASMDAGLALHLQSVGFNTQTETLVDPSVVRPASMSGCGSVNCS